MGNAEHALPELVGEHLEQLVAEVMGPYALVAVKLLSVGLPFCLILNPADPVSLDFGGCLVDKSLRLFHGLAPFPLLGDQVYPVELGEAVYYLGVGRL